MNVIFVSTASIFAIVAVVWVVNRLFNTRLCPICLGVGGTWFSMIVARFAGMSVDPTMLAILLGGSVAGTAGLLEKRLPQDRSKLAWNALFIPFGFIGAYAAAMPDWTVFAGATVAALIVTAVFFRPSPSASADNPTVADLKRRMKDCC